MGYTLIDFTINVKYDAESTSVSDVLPSHHWSKILDAWADKFSSFSNITKGTNSGADSDNYYCRFNNDVLVLGFNYTGSASNRPQFGIRSSDYQPMTGAGAEFFEMQRSYLQTMGYCYNKTKAQFIVDDATNNVVYLSTMFNGSYRTGKGFLFANDTITLLDPTSANLSMYSMDASPTNTKAIMPVGCDTNNYSVVYLSNVLCYETVTPSSNTTEIVDHIFVVGTKRVAKSCGEIISINKRKYMTIYGSYSNDSVRITIPIDSIEEQSIDIE